MDTLINIAGRLGLLLCAAVLALLAYRLHKKAAGKYTNRKKTAAVILMLIAGLCLAGTFVGDWMAGNFGATGGYFAAFLVLVTVGPVLIDWVADGKPDRVALWATLAVPLALFIGAGQVGQLTHLIGDQAGRLSDTVSSQVGK